MRPGRERGVGNVAAGLEDQVQGIDGGVEFAGREMAKAIDHAHAQIVVHRELFSAAGREAAEQCIEEAVIAISHIDPLCDQKQQAGGVWRFGTKPLDFGCGAGQHLYACFHAPKAEG